MSPKKLSDEEKTELVRLYRQNDETTATLAERFRVSSSTVSRVLRNHLSSEEYINLIQQKRHNRQKYRFQSDAQQVQEKPTASPEKQSETPETSSTDAQAETFVTSQPPKIDLSYPTEETSPSNTLANDPDETDNLDQIDFSVIQAMFGEDVGDDDDLDETEEEDWEDEEETVSKEKKRSSNEVEVLPLSQAKFPKICYLVVDKGANLITKPLKEFSDLGKIPSLETQQKTLPVFENHRGARRFSNRSQKVIKIPDAKMIKKTREQLEAKGIKRILMDGKVYTLS